MSFELMMIKNQNCSPKFRLFHNLKHRLFLSLLLALPRRVPKL